MVLGIYRSDYLKGKSDHKIHHGFKKEVLAHFGQDEMNLGKFEHAVIDRAERCFFGL